MNDLESQEATAQELVVFATQRGLNLTSIRHDFAFYNGGRFIMLWRKEGRILYNMQGPVEVLPNSFKASASLFRGMWGETGSVTDLEQALELLKAWLIDGKEVDDLPQRKVRSEGIG